MMMTLKTFINKHPVLIYFVLTFTISWGGLAIAAGAGGNTALKGINYGNH